MLAIVYRLNEFGAYYIEGENNIIVTIIHLAFWFKEVCDRI